MDRIRPAPRLGDDLYRSLAPMIDRQELPEGARLPAEIALAKPVRRLAADGARDPGALARRRPYRLAPRIGKLCTASRVGAPSPPQAAPTYRAIDSVEQIKQSYEFRRAVEGEAAPISPRKPIPTRISRTSPRRSRGSIRAFAERLVGAEADFRFHLAVAAATRNSWFVATLQAMRAQIEVDDRYRAHAFARAGARITCRPSRTNMSRSTTPFAAAIRPRRARRCATI